MFEKITKYRTADGAEHSTESQAREHVTAELKTGLIRLVSSITEQNPTLATDAVNVYAIAAALYTQRAELRQLLKLETFKTADNED
jgi:hypothetical protein